MLYDDMKSTLILSGITDPLSVPRLRYSLTS